MLDQGGRDPEAGSNNTGTGFDAIGVTVLDLVNDGSDPCTLFEAPPAPQKGRPLPLRVKLIVRMANEYDATFSHI